MFVLWSAVLAAKPKDMKSILIKVGDSVMTTILVSARDLS